MHGLHLDAEDAIDFAAPEKRETSINVIVPLLPHISNHTDFDPLMLHPNINFQWVKHNETIPSADLIILPGSKNIAFDMQWLKDQKWERHLKHHLRYGGKLIGICGGLQMIGKTIHDPHHIESDNLSPQGFGLLDYETTLMSEKTLQKQSGHFIEDDNTKIEGYEIHCGQTELCGLISAIQLNNGKAEGGFSEDNQIFVTYLHGLFDQPESLNHLMKWATQNKNNAWFVNDTVHSFEADQHRLAQLDRLADTIESNLDLVKLFKILGVNNDR